jgi:hypothetical protein
MSIESWPRTVTIWGVVIALLGGVLIAVVPTAVNIWWVPNTEPWSLATEVFEIILDLARTLLAPLGAALIAAGLVMRYVDRRLTGETISDRPRRWRWPDEAQNGNG